MAVIATAYPFIKRHDADALRAPAWVVSRRGSFSLDRGQVIIPSADTSITRILVDHLAR
jgi:hypothetical protein